MYCKTQQYAHTLETQKTKFFHLGIFSSTNTHHLSKKTNAQILPFGKIAFFNLVIVWLRSDLATCDGLLRKQKAVFCHLGKFGFPNNTHMIRIASRPCNSKRSSNQHINVAR